MFKYLIFFALFYCSLISCGQSSSNSGIGYNYTLSDQQWKSKLSHEQYKILRRRGTEAAFTGKYWNNKTQGLYQCAGCQHPLFSSATQFKSGTGWPSFYSFIENGIDLGLDNDVAYSRNEVHCANCGGHLGHVFEDGPQPTGMRYCVNSAALIFRPE